MQFKFDFQSWVVLAAIAGFIYGEWTHRGELDLVHGVTACLAVGFFCMWSLLKNYVLREGRAPCGVRVDVSHRSEGS